jgi:hypothetical protein
MLRTAKACGKLTVWLPMTLLLLSLNVISYVYHFTTGILRDEEIPSEGEKESLVLAPEDDATKELTKKLFDALKKMLEVVIAGDGGTVAESTQYVYLRRFIKFPNMEIKHL